MPTVTNQFNRYPKNIPAATPTAIMVANVPSSPTTQMAVMGLTIANTTNPSVEAVVDVYLKNGASDYYIIKGTTVPPGESLVVIGWDQKLVLTGGDNIYIRTAAAGQTVDAVLSVLEIVTT